MISFGTREIRILDSNGAVEKGSFRLMKPERNYDRRDDLLHRRTSERVFNLSHDFFLC